LNQPYNREIVGDYKEELFFACFDFNTVRDNKIHYPINSPYHYLVFKGGVYAVMAFYRITGGSTSGLFVFVIDPANAFMIAMLLSHGIILG
jgi:hypothetical protein